MQSGIVILFSLCVRYNYSLCRQPSGQAPGFCRQIAQEARDGIVFLFSVCQVYSLRRQRAGQTPGFCRQIVQDGWLSQR